MSVARDLIEDIRTIDEVTVTANSALPKSGGELTGPVTTSSTIDGRTLSTDGTKLDGIAASANNYVLPSDIATESYVGTQVSALVAAAPATLDTLNELAAALGDDPNFATTMTTTLGDMYSKAETDSKIVELSPPATKSHVESLGILANTITGALPAIDGSLLTNLPSGGIGEFKDTSIAISSDDSALANDDGTANANIGIGYQAGYNLTTGQYNVLNGYQAGYSLTTGSIVAIGKSAGEYATTAARSTYVGEQAGQYSNNSNVTAVGRKAGMYLGLRSVAMGDESAASSTASYVTSIGALAGQNAGANSVHIGAYAGISDTAANSLNIANNSTESLIKGDFLTKTLKVNGTFSSTGKTYITKTAGYTAIAGDLVMADTATTGAFTITLPTSPTSGDVINIHDVKGNFATSNLTVARGVTSQEPINGIAEDFICDLNYQNLELLFTNVTDGWRII